jgi:hypothetical protein
MPAPPPKKAFVSATGATAGSGAAAAGAGGAAAGGGAGGGDTLEELMTVDLNKLAAKVMRAKLMGKPGEYDRSEAMRLIYIISGEVYFVSRFFLLVVKRRLGYVRCFTLLRTHTVYTADTAHCTHTMHSYLIHHTVHNYVTQARCKARSS